MPVLRTAASVLHRGFVAARGVFSGGDGGGLGGLIGDLIGQVDAAASLVFRLANVVVRGEEWVAYEYRYRIGTVSVKERLIALGTVRWNCVWNG